MKKIFKLAMKESHLLFKFFMGIISICWYAPLLLNEPGESANIGDVFMMIGSLSIMVTFIMCIQGNYNIKFLKTLPLTNRNITSIFAISTYLGVPVMLIGISVWCIIMGKPYMIPYYFCALTVSAALGTVLVPLLVKPVNEAGVRKAGFREIAFTIVIMLGGIAAGTVLCLKGYRNARFVSGDIPMLIAVFAACIALTLGITAVYRKKLSYWIAA